LHIGKKVDIIIDTEYNSIVIKIMIL